MLVVVDVALPASIAGTIFRQSAIRSDALWTLTIWGAGIALVAVAIGARWRHSTVQMLLQFILVTAVYSGAIAIGEAVRDENLTIHLATLMGFALIIVLPLVLRRRALERHPPGPERDRLLAVAAVGLAAGLNLATQIAYMVIFTIILG